MKPLLPALVLVACAAAACERREAVGPPQLHLGRDQCSVCGMIIHDERSAGSVLVERDGRREHVLFDDIGCMLESARSSGADVTVVARYVHDHAGGGWLSADSAFLLVTDGSTLRTPMGSGIAAFADEAGAAAGEQEFGGQIVRFAALQERTRRQPHAEDSANGR